MSAVHREWVNAQADRVVLVVDQVASVSRATATVGVERIGHMPGAAGIRLE